MKKRYISIVTVFFYLLVAGITVNAKTTDKIVKFQSKEVETSVRQIIKKPKGDIYKADVLKIEKLNVKGNNLKSLNGIENLLNLKEIKVYSETSYKLDPLKKLTKLRK